MCIAKLFVFEILSLKAPMFANRFPARPSKFAIGNDRYEYLPLLVSQKALYAGQREHTQ
jgi:hypothetical protein